MIIYHQASRTLKMICNLNICLINYLYIEYYNIKEFYDPNFKITDSDCT
jgi:hypothetical protein